ncbi:MAG: hypothetical protein ACRDHZ_21145, partial [Ktedonobacteraceae bacterium]
VRGGSTNERRQLRCQGIWGVGRQQVGATPARHCGQVPSTPTPSGRWYADFSTVWVAAPGSIDEGTEKDVSGAGTARRRDAGIGWCTLLLNR